MSRRSPSAPPVSSSAPPARSNRGGMPVPDACATAPWVSHPAQTGFEATVGYGGGFGGGAYAFPPPPPPPAVAPVRASRGRREVDDTNVYVARLPPTMTLELFKVLMERYGTVISSRLLEGGHWNIRGVRGVGFARMSTPEEASKAIIGLNNKRLAEGMEPLQARLAFKKNMDGVNIALAQPAFQPDLSWMADPGQGGMMWGPSGYPEGYGMGHQQGPGMAACGPNGAPALLPDPVPQPGDYSGWTSGYYGHPFHNYYGGAGVTYPSTSQQGFVTGGETTFGRYFDEQQQQRQNVFCSPSDVAEEKPKIDVKTPEGGAVLNITGAATMPVSEEKILNVVVEKEEGARKPTPTRVNSGNNIVLCESVTGVSAFDENQGAGPASC